MFEDRWTVALDQGILTIREPDQADLEMGLDRISGIAIATNDSGPLGTDVVWYLSDGDLTVRFPMGATGEAEVIQALQHLDGFDNQAMLEAMTSTDDRIFVLLDRGGTRSNG